MELIADELFLADEREAWGRYLRDTKGWRPDKYEQAEPSAWRRLTQQLSVARLRCLDRQRNSKPSKRAKSAT